VSLECWGLNSISRVDWFGGEDEGGWSGREWRNEGFGGIITSKRFSTDTRPLIAARFASFCDDGLSTIRRSDSGIDHQDGRHLRWLGRIDVQGRQGGSVLDGGDGACESWRSTFSTCLKVLFVARLLLHPLTSVLGFVSVLLPPSHLLFGVHR
jgi:hypothetical protein